VKLKDFRKRELVVTHPQFPDVTITLRRMSQGEMYRRAPGLSGRVLLGDTSVIDEIDRSQLEPGAIEALDRIQDMLTKVPATTLAADDAEVERLYHTTALTHAILEVAGFEDEDGSPLVWERLSQDDRIGFVLALDEQAPILWNACIDAFQRYHYVTEADLGKSERRSGQALTSASSPESPQSGPHSEPTVTEP